jgi:hypothetical protein
LLYVISDVAEVFCQVENAFLSWVLVFVVSVSCGFLNDRIALFDTPQLLPFQVCHAQRPNRMLHNVHGINTLRTGDANLRFLRFCITTVKDE